MKMKFILSVTSIYSLSILASSAAISMIIDPTTKEISFSGTASGTALDLGLGTFQVASWNNGLTSGSNETLVIGAAFNESFSNAANLIVFENTTTSNTGLRIVFANNGATLIPAITANATKISYAGMAANFIAVIDNYPSGDLIQNQGSGYGDISFTNTAVPEPSSSTLLLATCMLGLSIRRRK